MRRTSLIALVLAAASLVWARYEFFTPKGSFAVEVSLDNAPYLRLPIYRNAITSLEVIGDYAIGGTSAESGLRPFLFAVSLSKRKLEIVYPLEKTIPGQRAIQSGFGRGADGTLYAGTMPDRPGESGHLIAVRVKAGAIDVIDLGVPVKGEGVFTLTFDPKAGALYGISHPSGKFFVSRPNGGAAEVYEQTAPNRRGFSFLHEYALEPADVLSRRLAIDRSGRVYGSMPANKLFRFDSAAKKVDVLPDPLPEVWGRSPLGRVDAWAVASDGTLYGGNAGDGQLFKLDPATGKVTNLGKAIMMPRLKGIAFARDGRLYGIAGGAPGYSHLFSYSPSEGYRDLGNPRFPMVEPGLEQEIPWRGFQLGTLAVSEDGRYVVMGEEEALSQLMVFPVE